MVQGRLVVTLLNDTGGLRLTLGLEQWHGAHCYGAVSVDALDRRDEEFWAMVRLPVVKMAAADVRGLVDALKECCAGGRAGVSVQLGEHREVALSVSVSPDGGFVIEVGFDLASVALEHAGIATARGRELSLFRLMASTSEVVRFGDALAQQLRRSAS